ncbi:MAG: TrmB family transcriptional regulator [Minisyncoccota bacterium]
MSTLLSHLQEFGLSKKEVAVYQTLLDTGSAGAHEIAGEAKINRSSVYILLEALVERGLVEQSQHNGILEYRAVSPKKLIEWADELAQDSARQEKEMDALLPELLSVSKKLRSQPRVLFYEGVGGIQTVSNDLLTQPFGTPVYTFLPIPEISSDSALPFLDNQDLRRKYEMKIIFPYKEPFKKMVPIGRSVSNIRCVPADMYPFSSELRIYADKIAFISMTEEFGVIIQSQDVADVMKSLFGLAWEEAGYLDAKIRNKVAGKMKEAV